MPRRLLLLSIALVAGCAGVATDRGDTVVFASGADLQSINPLLTTHPLARQVQRYVLLTTLVRYDSALQMQPYLARSWQWSPDRRALTLTLTTAVRWHDGITTTARDAAWTIDAARDPATGYPRVNDLAQVSGVHASDDSTLTITFDGAMNGIPDVLTDLAILPAHLLDSVPHARLRDAAWNQAPVGNGPFRFLSHAPNRRWVFAANPDFPPALDGPPRIGRLVIAVVDEPATKLAALASGELDFAGINPAHASFVGRDPRLAVMQYPLQYSYAVVFNTRRAPFNDIRVRRAISLAVDRNAIINGYLFGFAAPATGPQVLQASDTTTTPDLAAARALIGGRT
ncbi:MAG: ABC transporter substrate-binding protein, partial [Gemmatimonadota bacterium]